LPAKDADISFARPVAAPPPTEPHRGEDAQLMVLKER